MPAAPAAKAVQRRADMRSPKVEPPAPIGAQPDVGASAGMPMFLQFKGNGKGHGTAIDSSGDEEELLRSRALPGAIQAKVAIGAADDPLEHEADRVAQSVTSTSADDAASTIRRQPASAAVPHPAPSIAGSEGGMPLASHVRERIEPALGADLGGVRVHAGPSAHRAADALNARAFTHQNHIWLGASQSPEDVELMAHEATHVVQQRAVPTGQELVQRRVEHPEDGAAVQQSMGQQVAEATRGDDEGDAGAAADSADAGADAASSSEATHAAQAVDPAEREARKAELEPYSKPPVDRAAAAEPLVAQAAADVQSEADAPAEALAEGEEKSPAGGEAGAAGEGGDVSALGAASFAQAAAQAVPSAPPPVQLPVPVAPVNAEGEALPPDVVADEGAAQLGGEIQRMRDEAQVARQRASGLRANAHLMRGNIRIAKGASDSAEEGISRAREHVETRKEVVAQGREALAVSEEKAAAVAAQAPEYSQRATQTHEDSGPMATEAQEKAGAAGSNTPDDEEAAGKMQAASGQMTQVGSDATSVDGAVTGTQAKGEALVQDAAQAQEKNVATSGKLEATDAAVQETDDRLGELEQQNVAARAQVAALEHGPAHLDAGAASTEDQALAVIAAADDLETQIHAAQEEFAVDMRAIPGSKAVAAAAQSDGSAPQGVIQRDAHSAYGSRERVDILSPFRSPPSIAEQREQEEAAVRAATRRRDRLREINDRANGHFENLSALDKMGLALDIVGENLMGDLGAAKWPNILGQIALAFVDPRVSLEGVVSGLNMTLSGAANLLSLQQWEADPLGNLLKSAADIATGLTIILGSIAGLCTAILVILGALAIITFGAMGPAFVAASAFLCPIITTVGGWAISCAAIAAELQFYVLIKNLVDAATATTAEGLEHESDQMTEDATQAANMAAQVVVAGVMEAGGAAFAETAAGQRLGALATSVGERFDMIPPPRGAPLLEPGVTAPPEALPPAVDATPPAAPAVDVTPPAAPAVDATPPAAPAVDVTPPAAPAVDAAPVTPPGGPPAEPPGSVPPTPPRPPRMGTVTADSTGFVEHPTSNPVVETVPPRRGGAGSGPEPLEPAGGPAREPVGEPVVRADPAAAAEAARAQVQEHLESMLDNNITPEDLGFNRSQWEQLERDFANSPERALAELEGRLRSRAERMASSGTPEDAAGYVAAVADDVRDQINPRTSEQTTGPERARAAAEAAERGPHPDDMRTNEAEIGSTVPDEPPEGGPFVEDPPGTGTYDRPSGWPDGMRDEVWERARGPDGHVRDPVTNEIMDPNDPWVMGHEPGYEFWKHQQSAAERGIPREQFRQEYYDSPYRPETPETSSSHVGEDKTDLYHGP